ncbi:MAG: putative kinase, aminoglycoside phosphotransferase family [Acidimicrobiales bacterium]|nr:putative kinase, aminoglycoside phosphotransferase family [Acidimicrobiales bacterium]
MGAEELATALTPLLAAHFGDERLRIDAPRRLSGGASRETWSFDAVLAGGGLVPLVFRREIARGVEPFRQSDEGALLRAAAKAGVPVPAVVLDGELAGRPFLVMARVAGETIPRRILRDDGFAGARAELAAQCGAALAAIHTIPLDAVPALTREDPLPFWRAMLDGLGRPHPAFELAFTWLGARQPASVGDRTTVVHGDFRNGNLIVGPEGLRAVIDWELAHLGDPMEDLGWLCVKAWRFGAPSPVGGFGSREQLFDAYAAAAGTDVDPGVVHWWEVVGTLKWGIMCIAQATTHLSGATRSVELAAIGRRVCENEWDLLDLMGAR